MKTFSSNALAKKNYLCYHIINYVLGWRKMKRIYKLILEACGLSVLITSIFFIFEKISSPDITPALPIGRYFLILLLGFIVVCANLLFGIRTLHKIVALLIHYLAIFTTFLITFVGFNGMTPTKFFIYIVMFTIFYAIIFAIAIGVKILSAKADAHISAKSPTPKKTTEYKSRYK